MGMGNRVRTGAAMSTTSPISATSIKSAHAPLLNRLHQMQQSPYYAIARTDLANAERTILQLESEVIELKRSLATEKAKHAPKRCYCDDHQGTNMYCPTHGTRADETLGDQA